MGTCYGKRKRRFAVNTMIPKRPYLVRQLK
jgi:hypothetical protein